jgi:hypothetical protein
MEASIQNTKEGLESQAMFDRVGVSERVMHERLRVKPNLQRRPQMLEMP